MMVAPSTPHLTDDQILSQIGQHRPEVVVPGYWDTLAQNCTRWADEVSVGPLWHEAKERLSHWRHEYRAVAGSDLLSVLELPRFVAKPANSIRGKLLRRCRQDQSFLSSAIAPTGPPVPQIGDIVRTRVACRYIDGVEFFGSKLCELAELLQLKWTRERQGRLEGYFAQHITVSQDVIYRLGGVGKQTTIVAEVQVATDFGTRMWDATHPLYESVRGSKSDPASWQWQPGDPRFIAHQLGHMIHLADGLLMQLREAQSTKTRSP